MSNVLINKHQSIIITIIIIIILFFKFSLALSSICVMIKESFNDATPLLLLLPRLV